MRACMRCKVPLRRTTRVLEDDVAGRHFELKVAAAHCPECGEVFLPPASLKKFELHVAEELARDGPPTGEALHHMRTALGMPAVQAAKLLGVTPETISRWERGKREANARMVILFGVIVRDAAAGESTTLENLQRAVA